MYGSAVIEVMTMSGHLSNIDEMSSAMHFDHTEENNLHAYDAVPSLKIANNLLN